MRNHLFVLILLTIQFNYCQLAQEDIGKYEIEEGTYQLDILDQKLDAEKAFKTTKHNRFEIEVVQNKIKNQKIYDTINKTIALNRKFVYLYNDDNSLKRISETDFDKNIISETTFLYNRDNKLIYRTTTDEEFIESKVIVYNYNECKPEFISDLLNDVNSQNPNKTFKCKTITITKKISNYTTSVIEVFKIGTGLVKKIDLKSGKDSGISRFYTYKYDENGNVVKINLHRNDKVKIYKTIAYNKNNDVIKIKQGYSELYYTYKYDKNNYWTEKIETSKNKIKRRVFRQIITY